MSKESVLEVAGRARKNLEMGHVDIDYLAGLYLEYNPVPNVRYFVQQALSDFPKGGCGLASVYLKDLFGEGEIREGKYQGFGHTVLLDVHKVPLLDITADQFGGPVIYAGEVLLPWQIN